MTGSKLKCFWMSLLAALGLTMLLSGGALAQSSNFPKRQITLIVPAAPGGFLDIAARIIGKDVTDRTGTSIIVEFRQGGGWGRLCLLALKQAAPDGHTLLEGNTCQNALLTCYFRQPAL